MDSLSAIRLFIALVQRYAPEIDKRIRPHLKLAGASYRIDETYVKVGTAWKYLYRAIDSAGNTFAHPDKFGLKAIFATLPAMKPG